MSTIVLAHDHFLAGRAKTAEALLRYGRDPVVAVVDRTGAGRDASEVVGPRGACVPVVASMAQALKLGPETLAIGVAPVGGRLPSDWRQEVVAALHQGVNVVSGLHDFFADDAALAAAATKGGATITDVRRPPAGKPIYSGAVLDLPCKIVLTVGTDCSSGKMTTSVEVVRALAERGVPAAFAATGQTGLMIGCDSGVVVDAVPSDFVAGWSERITMEAFERTRAEVVLVEGQGALSHPAYGSVSLGLLHGASPHACILCHDTERPTKHIDMAGGRTWPVLRPADEWGLDLALAHDARKPQLIGLATMGKKDADRTGLPRGLPVADVLHGGCAPLADAVEALL